MPDEKPFSFDSIEDAHSSIQDASPAPNLAAIEAHTEETQETIKETSSRVDSAGIKFNPELHAVNKDGDPSLTSTQKFRKKKGVSKVARAIEVDPAEQERAAARAAGRLAADMMVHSSILLLGNEWAPIGSQEITESAPFNEHENLRNAFGEYFAAKGISDFPPGIALSIAVSGYILPRIAAGKETKTRLGKAKIWLSEFANKFKRKKKDAAQPDTRNDRERENDAGKTTSEDEPTKATGRDSSGPDA